MAIRSILDLAPPAEDNWNKQWKKEPSKYKSLNVLGH